MMLVVEDSSLGVSPEKGVHQAFAMRKNSSPFKSIMNHSQIINVCSRADSPETGELREMDELGELAESLKFHDDPFYDLYAPISLTHRNLPHLTQPGATYFVTWRLADSIPEEPLKQLQLEREIWLSSKTLPLDAADRKKYHRLFSQPIEEWMDNGYGACLLRDSANAEIVAEALKFFDGLRYELGDWVIMPNHVHVLVKPLEGYFLKEILHSWKSFTAHEVNKRLNRSGRVWQKESYDRMVRDRRELEAIEEYILNNPVKAGLKGGQYRVSCSVPMAAPAVPAAKNNYSPETGGAAPTEQQNLPNQDPHYETTR